MSMLDWAGGLARWSAGAVVPMFARPVPPVGLAWFAHAVLVAVVLVLAFLVQRWTGWVEVKRSPDWFKPYWLMTVAALVYLLLWAAGYLRDTLAPVRPEARYPDLDEAWEGVQTALRAQGISLQTTPLFLVLGEMPGGVDPFFRAMPHGMTVAGGNPSDWSLQVYGNRDAVFLTVPGASLLGAHSLCSVIDLSLGSPMDSMNVMASIGLGRSIRAGFGSLSMSLGGGGDQGSIGRPFAGSIGASIGGAGGGTADEIQRLIRTAREQGRALTAAEKDRIKELTDAGGRKSSGGGTGRSSGGAASVLQNPALVAEAEGRIAHLCALIAAGRHPAHPVCGAILAVPANTLDTDPTAQQWGEVARHDFERLELHLRVCFPIYAVVTGLEAVAGGATFFEKFAVGQSARRLGKGFPMSPAVPPDQVLTGIDRTAKWVLGELLPSSALKLTRVTGNLSADTAENAGLCRFQDAARKRGQNLSRLLARAVTLPERVPGFAGCYVTVPLASNPGEAAFARDLFAKLLTATNCAAWTPEAFRRDAAFRRSAAVTNLLAVAVMLLVVGLAGYVGYRQFGG